MSVITHCNGKLVTLFKYFLFTSHIFAIVKDAGTHSLLAPV
jgi:hypothetical protein